MCDSSKQRELKRRSDREARPVLPGFLRSLYEGTTACSCRLRGRVRPELLSVVSEVRLKNTAPPSGSVPNQGGASALDRARDRGLVHSRGSARVEGVEWIWNDAVFLKRGRAEGLKDWRLSGTLQVGQQEEHPLS